MNDFIMSALILIIVIGLVLIGAFAHEGDIQRACKEDGRSGMSTWRGELICSPVKK